jgi:hypothetical protein
LPNPEVYTATRFSYISIIESKLIVDVLLEKYNIRCFVKAILLVTMASVLAFGQGKLREFGLVTDNDLYTV